MRKTILGLSMLGSVLVGLAGAAVASPIGPGMRGPAEAQASGVQNVDFRRCWWDGGRRVCRYVYGYRDHDWREHHRWWRLRHHDRD